jgi:hypothetical protein
MRDLFTDARTHSLAHLTVTNNLNVVPVCSCGWVGGVHPTYFRTDGLGGRGDRVFDDARQAAKLEHLRHARG